MFAGPSGFFCDHSPEIQAALNKMQSHGFILAFIPQTPVKHLLRSSTSQALF